MYDCVSLFWIDGMCVFLYFVDVKGCWNCVCNVVFVVLIVIWVVLFWICIGGCFVMFLDVFVCCFFFFGVSFNV